MQDVFITKIHIDKVRHLRNVDIELSATERRHLILTGRNGSGKTSLLEAMRDEILVQQRKNSPNNSNPKDIQAMNGFLFGRGIINETGVDVSYSQNISNFFDVTFAFVTAKRNSFIVPETIEPVNILGKTVVTRNASRDFLKYILNLDYQLYAATKDNNTKLEKALNEWFDNLLTTLRTIYDCRELTWERDAKNFAFKIIMPGREPFALHEMSGGYAAFFDIYTELLMRFEGDGAVTEYERPAIVMIDEVETHLHVDLQKRVLPFLTQMFPKVQFIVSTHSPFVMTSLSDAVVYDLENKERLENPSVYSYEAVVEGYLDTGQYSEKMKNTFNRYRELCGKDLSAAETAELRGLVSALELVPPASKELYLAFRKMEDERKR